MTKKIFKSIMFVCALVLTVGLAAVMGILYSNFDGQMRKELSKEAAYLAYGVEQQGVDYLKNIKDKSARITYIDQDGTVLFDNEADVSEMKNHSDRTEFQKAEKYGAGESSRYSDTLSEKTIYYALRLKDGTVLRVSGTQDSVLALVENLIFPLCGLLCLMLILSGIMASAISKRIVKPINELDLESPEENRIYEELSPLLSKIHRQNREIQNQLELAKQQQEEFALITENMQEGLIVIDKYTMILSANSSAWNLFHMDRGCQGESVYCLDREEEFRHAIEQVLSGEHTELVLKLNGSDIQLIANPVIRDKKTEGAVEMIHTHSLIHDDLPALDDDDYRRGRLTTHKVYGEAMGVLSGVALLNYAYDTMFQAFALTKEQDRVIHALRVVSQKTGIHGMLGGQSVDVENDGKPLEKEMLDYIYRNKTSALIEASMMTGAILAGANEQEVSAVEKAAGNIGLAFQIQDDILDVTSTQEVLGKPVLSDEKNHKTTYVTLYGMEKAEKDVVEMSNEALRLIEETGENEFLDELVRRLIHREK